MSHFTQCKTLKTPVKPNLSRLKWRYRIYEPSSWFSTDCKHNAGQKKVPPICFELLVMEKPFCDSMHIKLSHKLFVLFKGKKKRAMQRQVATKMTEQFFSVKEISMTFYV